MKRIVTGMTLVALVGVLVAAPDPAFAGSRYGYRGHGGHRGHGHHYHKGGSGAGYLVGGLALGALAGVIIGGLAAPAPVYAAPPVVYQPAPAPPAPVYVAPPPPVCTDYYVPNTYRDGVWVGAHWERFCR